MFFNLISSNYIVLQEFPLSHHSSEQPQNSRRPAPLPRPRRPRILNQGDHPSPQLPPTKNKTAINGNGLQLLSMNPLPTSMSTSYLASPPPGGMAENGYPEPWDPGADLLPPRNVIRHSQSGDILYQLHEGGHVKKEERNNSVESYYGSNDSGFLTDADNKNHI